MFVPVRPAYPIISMFICFIESYQCPRSARAVYIGTCRSLLQSHDDPLSVDSLGSFTCIIIEMITHGRAVDEPVVGTGLREQPFDFYQGMGNRRLPAKQTVFPAFCRSNLFFKNNHIMHIFLINYWSETNFF